MALRGFINYITKECTATGAGSSGRISCKNWMTLRLKGLGFRKIEEVAKQEDLFFLTDASVFAVRSNESARRDNVRTER